MGEAVTPEQMGDMLITQRGGQRIYHSDIHIRDVATIEDGLGRHAQHGRAAMERSRWGVGIQKQHGENDVAVGQGRARFLWTR